MSESNNRVALIGKPACGNCRASAKKGDGSLSCRLNPPVPFMQFIEERDEETGETSIIPGPIVSIWPPVPAEGCCYQHKALVR